MIIAKYPLELATQSGSMELIVVDSFGRESLSTTDFFFFFLLYLMIGAGLPEISYTSGTPDVTQSPRESPSTFTEAKRQ